MIDKISQKIIGDDWLRRADIFFGIFMSSEGILLFYDYFVFKSESLIFPFYSSGASFGLLIFKYGGIKFYGPF